LPALALSISALEKASQSGRRPQLERASVLRAREVNGLPVGSLGAGRVSRALEQLATKPVELRDVMTLETIVLPRYSLADAIIWCAATRSSGC
jgi:hypothetical protein